MSLRFVSDQLACRLPANSIWCVAEFVAAANGGVRTWFRQQLVLIYGAVDA